jgi:acyl dehydratase
MRFADIKTGMVIESGPRRVEAEEIIRFASQYDPQWFHVDPERAARGRWKGLIASGWLTCGIMMELAVQCVLQGSECFGSPGVDALQWLAPVRPGDALRLRIEVLESRRSSSGGTGIVRWRWELWNQDGTQVLSQLGTSLFEIEPAAAMSSTPRRRDAGCP